MRSKFCNWYKKHKKDTTCVVLGFFLILFSCGYVMEKLQRIALEMRVEALMEQKLDRLIAYQESEIEFKRGQCK